MTPALSQRHGHNSTGRVRIYTYLCSLSPRAPRKPWLKPPRRATSAPSTWLDLTREKGPRVPSSPKPAGVRHTQPRHGGTPVPRVPGTVRGRARPDRGRRAGQGTPCRSSAPAATQCTPTTGAARTPCPARHGPARPSPPSLPPARRPCAHPSRRFSSLLMAPAPGAAASTEEAESRPRARSFQGLLQRGPRSPARQPGAALRAMAAGRCPLVPPRAHRRSRRSRRSRGRKGPARPLRARPRGRSQGNGLAPPPLPAPPPARARLRANGGARRGGHVRRQGTRDGRVDVDKGRRTTAPGVPRAPPHAAPGVLRAP